MSVRLTRGHHAGRYVIVFESIRVLRNRWRTEGVVIILVEEFVVRVVVLVVRGRVVLVVPLVLVRKPDTPVMAAQVDGPSAVPCAVPAAGDDIEVSASESRVRRDTGAASGTGMLSSFRSISALGDAPVWPCAVAFDTALAVVLLG